MLHTFWHFDAQKLHTILDYFGYILRQDKACGLFVFGVCVQNTVIVVELVEFFCKFVAVVRNTTRTVIDACLRYSCAKIVHLLNERNLLLVHRSIVGNCRWNSDALCSSLAENAADTCVGILNERTRVAIKVD